MTSRRDTTRVIRAWLEEGVTVLPERVLDQVLDDVAVTRQRRGRWARSTLAPALSAAAVLREQPLSINLTS